MPKASSRVRILPAPHVLVAAMCALCFAMPAVGQSPWDGPFKNLKAFPQDVSGDVLRGAMMSWTMALGVRCAHCHDDTNGQRFDQMDFASDAKAAKWTARSMMGLVRSANEQIASMATITHEAARVQCITCHRGATRPVLLEDLLYDLTAADGSEAAVAHYRTLLENYRDGFTYDFRAGSLNRLAERLTREGKVDDAIVFLQANLERFPESAEVHVGLGETALSKGDRASARAYFEKALELNPRAFGVRERLQELGDN